MKPSIPSVALIALLCLHGLTASSQSGKVFHDFNSNGIKDPGEPGIAGITVRSFSSSDLLFGTAVSDTAGNYALSPAASAGQALRVEFIRPAALAYLRPSAKGSAYGSGVQFVSGNQPNVNYALVNPARQVSADPILVNPRFVFGGQMGGPMKDTAVLLGMRNSWGTDNNSTGAFSHWNTHTPYRLATAREVGTVYGVAWGRKSKTLYTSAFYRQFSGFGPGGPAAIYKIGVDPVTGARISAPSVLVNVSSLAGQAMPANPHGTDTLYGGTAGTEAGFAYATKYGLGDLEISDDESRLYTINLYNRQVVAISATTGALINSWAVPTAGLTNSLGAVNPGDIRPFGLGYKDGKLYVGAVCSGQSTQTMNGTPGGALGNASALHAYIWTLDETSGNFTLVLDFKLTDQTSRWMTWQDSWTNGVRVIDPSGAWLFMHQPILSDIDFYGDDMILGFRDRMGDAWGHYIWDPVGGTTTSSIGRGDIYGARYNYNTGKFAIESDGKVGARTASGVAGCIGSSNEFYRGDGSAYSWDGLETASGAFVQLGTSPLASVQSFPSFALEAWPDGDHGGIVWMNNETGTATKAYSSFQSADMTLLPVAKAGGLGAVEALLETTPIEVGNRVWYDNNANGIQDAVESGVSGVVLELYNAAGTVLLATATTASNGSFYFNSDNVPGGLQPNTTYLIRVSSSQYNNVGMGPLAGRWITHLNRAGNGMPGCSDNDGYIAGGKAQILFTTGNPGESNHDLDFGFTSSVLSSASISSFDARLNNNMTDLDWTTVQESGLDYFDIERSTDGRNWAPVGRVKATGNSSNRVNYTFTDRSPVKPATNYYRLQQVGIDKEIHYSEVRTVKLGMTGALTIFPNPAGARATLNLPSELQGRPAAFRFINMSGQVVKQWQTQKAQANEQVHLNELPNGIYKVVITGTGDTYQTSLQINK